MPGTAAWYRAKADPLTWHFGLHQQRDVAEVLVAGREYEYLSTFYRARTRVPGAITDDDRAAPGLPLRPRAACRAMSRSPGHAIEPVAAAVTFVVHPGKQAEFAHWADEVDHAVSQFAGHLGSVRLHDPQGVNHLVYRFDTPAHLHAWETSAARRELLEQGDRISDERRTTTAGIDPWFNVSRAAAPPAWKTFLITWAAVYPLLLVIAAALTAIAPGLPRTLQLAVTSIVRTATLTWLVPPRVRAQLRPWLLHGARPVPTGGQSRSRDPDATGRAMPTTTRFASPEPRR